MSNLHNIIPGTEVEAELDWDSEIEKDAGNFVLLPDGEYDYEVVGFERARYNGGEKLPPCNQAKLKIQITSPEGITTINHNLFLHSKCEGVLSSFFCSIGQKKHGEKLKMDWSKVIGSKGRAKVATKIYNEKTYNEIKTFLDPVDDVTTQHSSNTPFKPGTF